MLNVGCSFLLFQRTFLIAEFPDFGSQRVSFLFQLEKGLHLQGPDRVGRHAALRIFQFFFDFFEFRFQAIKGCHDSSMILPGSMADFRVAAQQSHGDLLFKIVLKDAPVIDLKKDF